jgi:hypothetical protein|nr:MAG TPA: Protein of unknown function (DUF2674) [Caudoviricetes sp.]
MDFMFLMLLMSIIVLAVFCLIIYCKYKSLVDNYKYLNKELDRLSYEVYHHDNVIFKKCDKTLKEFNEIMFGNPPLKNKVVVVRSIKDYDYTAYRKDIESLNGYLKEGWSIVNHETSDFVHTYILGMPLVWQYEKEDDKGCDEDVE